MHLINIITNFYYIFFHKCIDLFNNSLGIKCVMASTVCVCLSVCVGFGLALIKEQGAECCLESSEA